MLARRRQSFTLLPWHDVVMTSGPGWFPGRAYIERGSRISSCGSWRRTAVAMRRSATRGAERMSNVFDIYTIIFLALAVFIFLRLRSVLGQRTGRERPPYDPYAARDAVRSPATDKVVTLPPRPAEPAPSRPVEVAPPAADRWKGVAETGSSVASGLDA